MQKKSKTNNQSGVAASLRDAGRAASRKQPAARRAAATTPTELLQIAIMRTEANITVCERSLRDLRAKHHNQCHELSRQLRTPNS